MSSQHSHPLVCCVHSGWTFGSESGLGGASEAGSGEEGWWSSPTALGVQARVAEYLRSEQEAMEGRVRAYADAEHRRFDLLRQEARRQRDAVLRDLAARGLMDAPADADLLPQPNALRLRNGSGDDSAVPLSPVSLLSNDPAPQPPAQAQLIGRPTNQSPVVGSEDSGLGPSRRTQDEELEEPLFSLDEEALPVFNLQPPALPPCLADDEAADTDDSGTGEDLRNGLKPPGSLHKVTPRKVTEGAGPLVDVCGKSLPVRVPCRFWPPPDAVASHNVSSSEEEEEGLVSVKAPAAKKDASGRRRDAQMAESMRKLARSIQPADDPERIFGERPQRRRYKSTFHAQGNVVRQRHSGRQHLQAFPDPLAAATPRL